MKFTEYKKQRELEEQQKGTGTRVSSSHMKFTDYMKQNDPQRYQAMQQRRAQQRMEASNDFIQRVNNHATRSNMLTANARYDVAQGRNTYNPQGAQDLVSKYQNHYKEMGSSALELMQEAHSSTYDDEIREQALNILMNTMQNQQVSSQNMRKHADWMNQFNNQEHFDRTLAQQQKQQEIDKMSAAELQAKIDESEAYLNKVTPKNPTENIATAMIDGLSKLWIGDEFVEKKKNIAEDLERYKSAMFEKSQQEALSKLSDESKDILEEYYQIERMGYSNYYAKKYGEYPAYIERDMPFTGNKHKAQAIEKLASTGIPEDEFESIYEYYKFARDKENAEAEATGLEKTYNQSNLFEKMALNTASVLSTPIRGAVAAKEVIKSLGYEDKYAPINTNSLNYMPTRMTDQIRGMTSSDIENPVANLAYQAGMSTADFVSLLPLNTLTSGASLAIMGTNAATQTTKEATERGVSKGQAILTGLTAGAAEVVFEKISLDHFWDIARNQGKAATRSAVLNVLAQAGIEGSEEVFTEIANTVTDGIINGDQSAFYQNVMQYYNSGMSMTDSYKKACVDFASNLAFSGLAGALSGGALGTMGALNTVKLGKENRVQKEDFVSVADETSTNRKAYATQQDYDQAMQVHNLAQALSEKEKVTDYEMGLFNEATMQLHNVKWDAGVEEVRRIASGMENETIARAFIHDYEHGVPVDMYARAFNNFYNAGYSDMKFENALAANDALNSMITTPTLKAIWYLGQNQAAEQSKIYASPEQQELVQLTAKALGVNVKYETIDGANGMYKDGTICISKKTINPSMVVLSHEMTHHLKQTAEQEYQVYEDYVIDYFKNFHAEEYKQLHTQLVKSYGNDEALIREEIAANAAETFLTNADFVNQFVQENQTIAQRIVSFLDNFIKKLRGLYQNYKAQGKAGKMLESDIEVYEKARELWLEAVNAKELSENGFPTETSSSASSTQSFENNNTPKFMKKQGIEDEIQQWYDTNNEQRRKKSLGFFKLGTTSDVLQSIGLNNVNVFLGKAKVQKILNDHPEMSINIIKKIPEILENPIMITSSLSPTNAKDSIVIFSDEISDGKSIILAMKIVDGKGEITEYTITGAHGRKKGSIEHYLRDSIYYYIEPDKKRTDAWLSALGVQFPSSTTKYGSIRSIPKSMQNNKEKFSLKAYADEIGIKFSSKDDFDLFESILFGTDDIDYQSVLVDDGSAEYATTMKMLNGAATILQDGMKAAEKLKLANIDKATCKSLATHYLNQYRATFDADTLADNLYNIFAYLQKTESIDYADMIRVMHEVCKPVLATSQKVDKEFQKQYNDFKNFIKGYHINLNESQKAEIANVYDSFKNFQNATRNKYHFTKNGEYLDSIWENIVEASGHALSYDTPVSSQMLELHDYMTKLEKSVITPEGQQTQQESAYTMALNIFTDYFRVIGNDNSVIKNIRTEMKKQVEEYKKDIRSDYQSRYKKAMEEEQLKKNAEINRLQKAIKELERERDDARYEADSIAVSALDGDIAALEFKIGKISKRNAEELAKLEVRGYNRSIKRAMSKQQTELRNHIKKNMFDLQNRLAKPTDNKHIPVALVRATIDLCEAVNLDNGKSEKLSERLNDMSHLYEKLKADSDYIRASEYDEHTKASIDRLKELFKDRNITLLNMKELQEVDDVITQIRHQIISASKLIREGKNQDAYEMAERCMDEIRNSHGATGKLRRVTNGYESAMLSPKRMFRRMSGYIDDSVLESLYDGFCEGQLKQEQVIMETAKIFESVIKGEHNQMCVRKFTGKNGNDWIDTGLTYKNREKVEVPRSFVVSLAMHMQNKANKDHIIYGGLTIPDKDLYMKGRISDSYKQGRTIQFIPAEKMSAEEREAYYKEAEKKLLGVISDLDPYEKSFLQAAEKFFHEYTGEKINETSLELNGYKKARVQKYFPIRTDSNFTHAEIDALIHNGTLEGSSMLESRVGARNPILLEDITRVIERQSTNVAKYYGLAIPVRNFKKIYNVTLKGYADSTKAVIAKKWGATGQKYIENLLVDIESSRNKFQESSIFDSLQGNFAQAVLTNNMSVALQQLAAYPTAAATLGWGPILKGSQHIFTKLDMENISKYTPVLWYRNQGTGTQDIGDIHRSKSLLRKATGALITQAEKTELAPLIKAATMTDAGTDKMLDVLQMIDTKAVGSLWKASEFYVMDKLGMKVEDGKDAFYHEVAKVFNECVNDTQANYTTLQRSEFQRKPDKRYKMIFMFMTQPIQNFNIVYDSIGNLNAKHQALKGVNKDSELYKDRKKACDEASKQFVDAISSQVGAAVFVFGMKLLSNILRHNMDRYRDKEDEISATKMVLELGDEVMATFIGSLVGGSDFYDLVKSVVFGEKYYGVGAGVIDSIDSFLTAIVDFRNDMTSDNLKQIILKAGSIFGVPIESTYKYFRGLGLHIEDAKKGEFLSFNAGHKTVLSTQYEVLLNAMIDENTEKYDKHYKKAYDALITSKTEDEAKKAIQSGIRAKLKKMYLEGKISSDQAINIVEQTGIENGYFKVKEWDNDEDDSYTKYSALAAAVEQNSGIEEAVKELTDHGVDDERVTQEIISSVKKAYKAGKMSASQATMYLTKYKKDFDATDAYWQLREWDKEDSYNKDAGESYGKYDDLVQAVELGTFSRVVKEYVDNGVESGSIKSALTTVYKEKYIAEYRKGNHKAVLAIKDKLAEVKVNGRRLFTQDDYLRWNKEMNEDK